MGRPRIDIAGQKFGLLTAMSFHSQSKAGTVWTCRCECGTYVYRLYSNIKKNHHHTCGCEPFRKTAPEAGFRRLFRDYKSNAEHRGYSFNLSDEDFKSLIFAKCHYCAAEPRPRYAKQTVHTILANGIDRIVNTEGYSVGNCVTCCKDCNLAKRSMSYSEFKLLIIRIYENMNLGN